MAVYDQPDDGLEPVRRRIRSARTDRRRYEKTWAMSRAFAAGQHHLQWARTARQLQLRKTRSGQERETTDVLSQYRQTALGELAADDYLPNLLFSDDSETAEGFAEAANDATRWGWDAEWAGDDVMLDVLGEIIDVGTCAVRNRFDPTKGKLKANEVPFKGGKPILERDKARAYVADEQTAGRTADIRTINDGAIRWELFSAEQLLAPPTVKRERDFPWFALERVEDLDVLTALYGQAAAKLSPEDTLLASSEADGIAGEEADLSERRLDNHVRVVTFYELPCPKYPKGRVAVLAGRELKPLHQDPELAYQAPDGTYRSGVSFFHWIRRSDAFFSRGLMEAGMGIQRTINRRSSQVSEIIDRGLPFIVADKATVDVPKGRALEVVALKPGAPPPTINPGVGPGPWMSTDLERLEHQLEQAMGFRSASLGENPNNVDTYSQLALLVERDLKKIEPIVQGLKAGVAELVECAVGDMREWWGPEKRTWIIGEDDKLADHLFDATKIPAFFLVHDAKGASKPRGQGATLQLINDIFNLAATTGQPLPISWYTQSIEAGKPVPLPESPSDIHVEKARMENDLLAEGLVPEPAYYDPLEVHINILRQMQVQAELSGDVELWDRCEQHAQLHLQVAQQNLSQMPQPPSPGGVPPPVPPDAQAGAGPGGTSMPPGLSVTPGSPVPPGADQGGGVSPAGPPMPQAGM